MVQSPESEKKKMTQYGNGRKRGVNDERRYGAPADGHHKRRKFDKGNQVDRNYERDLSTWEQLQKELITIGDGNQDNKSKTQIVIQLKMLQEMCNVQVLRENDVHSLILEWYVRFSMYVFFIFMRV